jgi:hypothetical protein
MTQKSRINIEEQTKHNNNSNQFNSFIYVLDNSQIWPITQPSTKTTVQVNIKKKDENIIKCTI